MRQYTVGHLEGWYVLFKARGLGMGRASAVASDDRGRSQGCTELASHITADNAASLAAHRVLGFDEAVTAQGPWRDGVATMAASVAGVARPGNV